MKTYKPNELPKKTKAIIMATFGKDMIRNKDNDLYNISIYTWIIILKNNNLYTKEIEQELFPFFFAEERQ